MRPRRLGAVDVAVRESTRLARGVSRRRPCHAGLLLSFLEASDKGAIAPSLLSQLAGGDAFPPPRPPPPPTRPSNDTSDWPGAALGGDFGFTDDFNLFGKKMSFSGDDLLGGGYSPGGFNAQPRMQRAGSRD
jgi:hypothetical protein